MTKTNTGLVTYAKAQLGKPYWYATFGNTSSVALYNTKKKQYPKQYQWECPADQLNKRVHDCVGLIKGYLWSETPASPPKYNAKQDVSANGMLQACKEKGAISTMPDVPGVLVFLPGHVGVYIGGGYVIEAKGHAYGVVKTKLEGRGWKNWGKCPWIDYAQTPTVQSIDSSPTPTKEATPQTVRVKKGDLVRITGTKYYGGGTIPSWVKSQNWYVREVSGAKVVIDKNENGTNSISSPVNAADLQVVKPATADTWIPAVGDVVTYTGTTHYVSANSFIPKKCKGGKAKITQVYRPGKSKHPYHLVHIGTGATVNGWVDDGTFKKA